MEEKLSKAAIEGDVHTLEKILGDDNQILEKIAEGCFKTNPLHLAISRDKVEFVKALLAKNKELAEVLDSGRSPLHLAAAKGNVEIVKALIMANRDMCMARDPDGRNPIHIAAMKGNEKVLKELVLANPNAARVKLDQNETVLHLCVKHDQFNTLELLLGMDIGSEFINAKDSCGNTIWHLAVSGKNLDIVKYVFDGNHFVHRQNFKINEENAEGHTAFDIVLLARKENYETFLYEAKCKRAKDVVRIDWLTKKRDTLMVVASLIAAMAFQAAVSPPAGVWQDNSGEHIAGEAVMAYNYPHSYPYFVHANTISFVASLTMILLLVSDVPFMNRFCMWLLVVIMWLTITATSLTYGFSIKVVTPKRYRGSLSKVIMLIVILWCVVMTFFSDITLSSCLKKCGMIANVERRQKEESSEEWT